MKFFKKFTILIDIESTIANYLQDVANTLHNYNAGHNPLVCFELTANLAGFTSVTIKSTEHYYGKNYYRTKAAYKVESKPNERIFRISYKIHFCLFNVSSYFTAFIPPISNHMRDYKESGRHHISVKAYCFDNHPVTKRLRCYDKFEFGVIFEHLFRKKCFVVQ